MHLTMWNENYSWHFDYTRLALDAGFCFDNVKKQSTLDKSKLSLLDVEAVIHERDIGTIERYIPIVVHFKLDPEQIQVLDPSFVKMFRVSQLSIQYLVFCKKYLDNTVVLLKKEVAKYAEDNKELNSQLNKIKHELNHEKKRVQDLENMPQPMNIATYKCDNCSKLFASEEFLLAHIKRRHETQPSMSTMYQEETNKLQLEIKQLKERLNSTEKMIHLDPDNEKENAKERHMSEEYIKIYELQQKFESLKVHVENELKLLQTQKNFQEKYEKWFEEAICKPKPVDDEKRTEDHVPDRKSSATQTKEVRKATRERAVSPCRFPDTISTEKTQVVELDIGKVQEQLSAETQVQLNKVEGVIEEMMATSLKKVENEVHTLINKIKVLESPQHKPNKKDIETIFPVSSNIDRTGSVQQLYKKPKQKKAVKPKNQPVFKDEETKHKKSAANQPKKQRMSSQVMSYTKSNSESDTEGSKNDSERLFKSKQRHQLDTRPSNTSTVGRRSITSLRKAVASDAVLRELQSEVEKVLQGRLKEIGVSSSWKGLPKRSFQQAMTIVNHQASLSQKTFPNYFAIRKKMVEKLSKQLKKKNKPNPVEESESSCTTVGMEHHDVPVPVKRAVNEAKPVPLIRQFEKPPENVARNVHTMTEDETDTESESPSNDHCEDEPSKPTVALQHSLFTDKKPEVIANKVDAKYSTVIQELKTVAKKVESESEDSAMEMVKKIEAQKMSIFQSKSALRSQPLPSIMRKKVLFDLDSGRKSADGKPHILSRTNEAGGSTTSIASSVFDGSKAQAVDVRKSKVKPQEKGDSDISDWDISEILN